MKISLLHPSRNRAAMAATSIAEWLGKSSGQHPIEYIFSIDSDDGSKEAYRKLAEQHGARLIINRNRNHVQAANQAARVATGELLILIADDFGCPERWDESLVRAIGDRNDVAVLIDDGLGARTMTLPIIDRTYYQRFGHLYFPGYTHMYCDNDLEEVSRRLGKLLDARHLLFPHRHYITGAAAYDQTYHRAGKSWGIGALMFALRQARDFDLRPATFRDVVQCSWIRLHYYVTRPIKIVRRGLGLLRPKLRVLGALAPAVIRRWRGSWRRRFSSFPGRPRPRPTPVVPRRPHASLAGEKPTAIKRLAVIVPFRDSQHPATLSQGEGREAQLARFLEHMQAFLANVDHHIFVIEQSADGLPFNKGCLMNVGFNLAKDDFDYFAFHDVDQLPTNPLNSYAFPSSPVHLCVTTDGQAQYRSMVGGVLLINREDFEACNGWSNHYVGWGQEDDDMANRLRNSVGFRRADQEIGTYTSLAHPRVRHLDETYLFHKNRAYRQRWAEAINADDGYRQATFELESQARASDRCTRYVVSIPGPSRLFGYHSYVKLSPAPDGVSVHEHVAVWSQIISLLECTLDRTRVRLRAGGGEMPAEAIPEEQEYADFEPGALQLHQSAGIEPLRFRGYQQRLLASAAPVEGPRSFGDEPVTTFVIERREYVNLYHTLIEIFNAYVAIELLARGEPFHLLFLDGHCRGALDPLWADILKPQRILRLHDYPRDATRFRKLVLVPVGYDSPLYNTGPAKPSRGEDFLSDFIATVLAAYGIAHEPTRDRVLTFVERRDYQPHPRSDGITCRKVDDLDSTVAMLQRLHPGHRVEVHSFEQLPLGQQLRIVRASGVLCGVHGAALALVLFMRPGSELVEFTPGPYRQNDIFKHLAGLRDIRYRRYLAQTKRVLAGGKLVVTPTDRQID
jgi:xylosylprotein 4-beta-galactosyltransferase